MILDEDVKWESTCNWVDSRSVLLLPGLEEPRKGDYTEHRERASVQPRAHTHVCMYVCVYVCMYVCMYV